MTAGPEFGVDLHGKNLIIDESLYGLKTSAARFHQHLSESLLRLGFKKTKHDPDLKKINAQNWWNQGLIHNSFWKKDNDARCEIPCKLVI
jgi:hypothetical protein